MLIKKAIIPAAGLGTRFLPATKAQSKEMLPIIDKPSIQYIVEEAVKSGIEDIIIITGKNEETLKDHFSKSVELERILEEKGQIELLKEIQELSILANIKFLRQEEPKGLGHAILIAKDFIGDEPFAVLLGDDIIESAKPCIGQMIKVYEKYKKCILGVQEVPKDNVNLYGIIKYNEIENRIYKILDMIEKPSYEEAPSNMAILGRYIMTPNIFKYLKTQKAGLAGEIQLTDALRRLSQDEIMYAYNFMGNRYDIGNKQGYLKATVEIALKRDDLKNEFLDYLKSLNL